MARNHIIDPQIAASLLQVGIPICVFSSHRRGPDGKRARVAERIRDFVSQREAQKVGGLIASNVLEWHDRYGGVGGAASASAGHPVSLQQPGCTGNYPEECKH